MHQLTKFQGRHQTADSDVELVATYLFTRLGHT